MNRQEFVSTWKEARDILGKRNITDRYIEHNAPMMKVEIWDVELVQDLFKTICSLNPMKVDLDADQIKSLYYERHREQLNKKIDFQEKKNVTPATKSNSSFFFDFYKKSRNTPFLNPNDFRDRIDYMKLDFHKKEMVDSYIQGRMEVRANHDEVPW